MSRKYIGKITQHKPCFEMTEAKAVYEYMLSGGYVTEHTKTEEFERKLAEYIGVKHCIASTSGTTALMLALLSLRISSNDEVIVPNITMIATANVVKFCGARLVLADVDADTYTLTVDSVKPYITERTKAIIHVSLNNRCREFEQLVDFCNVNRISLIEDAAQSLGCFYRGRHLGTYGKIGCFSLSTPKIISTGQGGFCVTNDNEIADRIRTLKNFGRRESGVDVYHDIGFNFKYTDLQAVIGIEQLKRLPVRVKRMREIYNLYRRELNIKAPPYEGWIPWFIDMETERREELMEYLRMNGISTRKNYPAINETEMYSDSVFRPNSSNYSRRGLFLPCYIYITDEEILFVCQKIKEFFS